MPWRHWVDDERISLESTSSSEIVASKIVRRRTVFFATTSPSSAREALTALGYSRASRSSWRNNWALPVVSATAWSTLTS